jgi:four helix bundle protein
MTDRPRQDLCERALRYSTDLLRFYRRTDKTGAGLAHMLDQAFRAGTAIGALLEEGRVANSRRDMAAKYAIALREAREALYWLTLIAEEPVLAAEAKRLAQEADEFVSMLTVAVRKLREPPPPGMRRRKRG